MLRVLCFGLLSNSRSSSSRWLGSSASRSTGSSVASFLNPSFSNTRSISSSSITVVTITSSRRRTFVTLAARSSSSGATATESFSKAKSKMLQVEPSTLAKAWSNQLLAIEEVQQQQQPNNKNAAIIRAATNTLPLLEDANSVPFVCRYRTDVIDPMTTAQVHLLHSLASKHVSLESLRNKLYEAMQATNTTMDKAILETIQTSTTKSELEELYAPFKPPSKGSILERIQKEHPALVQRVDALWEASTTEGKSTTSPTIDWKSLKPRDAVIHLLSCKVAAEPKISQVVLEELTKHCRISTSAVSKSKAPSSAKQQQSSPKPADQNNKYQNYHDFSQHCMSLRDHQVLAIRRGVDQKAIKMAFDMDGEKMEKCIRYHVFQAVLSNKNNNAPLAVNPNGRELLNDAIHDAWTRLLRRRGTTRLWKQKCQTAEERAIVVFEQNLRRGLLAPPLQQTHYILALDPGFQAGIKCAVLHPNGGVVQLATVKFLGPQQRDAAVQRLGELLTLVREKQANDDNETSSAVVIALGNGHGSHECRELIQEAADNKQGTTNMNIDIQLVNEAGASVWSVTDAAKREFPNEPPAAIAAISIGRRLQNPLFELVKVPPRSLGLGMYQHDLSEKELDDKLHLTSVDAVATVGVDLNSCSLEILQKVPGLNRLAPKVLEARPLSKRQDLLAIAGLGPKTFENCAAFCRVTGGPEPLDGTLVHPESYSLARLLLKQLSWKLSEPLPKNLPPRAEWSSRWADIVKEASERFGVGEGRVMAVLDNLVDSMTNVDPRLKENDESGGGSLTTAASAVDSSRGCKPLPPELVEGSKLQAACPVRGVIGTIRNIADFGAFIDFGGHNDGLLHTSKLGTLKLESLLIGQKIGVDILGVMDNNKVSLGLAGLNFQPGQPRPTARAGQGAKGGQRRNYSSSSSSSRTSRNASKPSGIVGSKRRISNDAKRAAKKNKTNR